MTFSKSEYLRGAVICEPKEVWSTVTIDFFEKELQKVKDRYNQTYGAMIVCNLRLRQAAILSIINLGLLCRKITDAKHRYEIKEDIRDFIKIRETLNKHFNQLLERMHHGTGDNRQGCYHLQ